MPWKVHREYKIRKEQADCNFEGTIVDLETIGPFTPVSSRRPEFGQDFIRKYEKIKVTTIGTLSDGVLQVAIALGPEHLDKFGKKALSIVSQSDRPLMKRQVPNLEQLLCPGYLTNHVLNHIRIVNRVKISVHRMTLALCT